MQDNLLFAAIDIGSNSFHLAIARYEQGVLKKIAAMSEKVQLGGGLDENNHLSKEAQERGLECLSHFADRIEAIDPACIRVVATNTLRQAVNTDEFIKKANDILPRPIEVISGREEARLIYLGVAGTQPSPKRRFVVDIGGGSTELIIGQGDDTILTESAQMGAVSFTQRFFSSGIIDKKSFDAAVFAAKKEIVSHAKAYQKTGFEWALGSSGTVKSVQKALSWLKLSTGEIDLKGVLALQAHLLSCGHVECIDIAAIKDHRKPIFPAGLAILLAVMEVFDIKELHYCDGALREGVIFEMLGRQVQSIDVRKQSVQKLAGKFDVDKKQVKRMQKTLSLLFEAAQLVLCLTVVDKEWLGFASWLHEIGLLIGHSGYHRHGAYVVKNAEIAGFSKSDQMLMAHIIQHHRRNLDPKSYRVLLEVGGIHLVHLVLLFRLAALMNQSRHELGKKPFVFVVSSPEHWQIFLDPAGVHYDFLSTQLQDEPAAFLAWGIHLQIGDLN